MLTFSKSTNTLQMTLGSFWGIFEGILGEQKSQDITTENIVLGVDGLEKQKGNSEAAQI